MYIASGYKKIHPLLKNLDKLTKNIEDSLQLRQLTKVIDDIKNEFKLDNCID